MHPKQTLEWMADLKASMSRPRTHLFLGGFLKSLATYAPQSVSLKGGIDQNTKELGEYAAEEVSRALSMSEAFFLDKDMLPVVQWAAQSLDEDATFEDDLWPSRWGFVLLDEAWIGTDARGRRTVTKALSWFPHPQGMLVAHWNDVQDERDDITTELLTGTNRTGMPALTRNQLLEFGRLQMAHLERHKPGEPVGPSSVDTTGMVEVDNYGLPLLPVAENTGRFILAFLMLLNQTVTATERHQLPAKGAARMTKRRLPSAVTVVRLRRIAGVNRNEGESHIEWAHRWLVRGHWRNQPVGKRYPGAREIEPGKFITRIWIAPFVKGPEGMPFKVSQKVYALDR